MIDSALRARLRQARDDAMTPVTDDPRLALTMIALLILVGTASAAIAASTAELRYERDISRLVFHQNWEALDEVRRRAGALGDSLAAVRAATRELPADAPYIVVSLEDRRLWLRKGDHTLFTTRVAVGSGKTLVQRDGAEEWRFDTPRGRLVILRKETDPIWVPPDWHFVEQARDRNLGILSLQRGESILLPDGSEILVDEADVVRRFADSTTVPFGQGEGREIVAGPALVIPPFGTNQRRYPGVLGSHRLHLGDGYALHGTDKPASIGQAVSHGCIRLRNEDIAYLYDVVPVGTQVFVY